jgi:hypothetical protein
VFRVCAPDCGPGRVAGAGRRPVRVPGGGGPWPVAGGACGLWPGCPAALVRVVAARWGAGAAPPRLAWVGGWVGGVVLTCRPGSVKGGRVVPGLEGFRAAAG